MKFRKRPVVIEAIQFTDNDSALRIARWAGSPPVRLLTEPGEGRCYGIEIVTLEGTMLASLRDWVIRGVDGEFYPCKPDIFARTYEKEAE